MPNYKTFYTNVYTAITEVRLYAETVEHIKQAHPEIPIELPSILGALETAISTPSWIEASNTNNKSMVFVDQNSLNRSGNPLRVPVKVITGTSGLIKTAFFAEPSSPPRIIWRSDK